MLDFWQLTAELQQPGFEWVLAFVASLMIGISKAGLKGIGIVIVTLMAFVFGSRESTGIILPLLIVGDIFAVWYYNRHTQWKYLAMLLPWMMGGVLFGVWIGDGLPKEIFKMVMAGIVVISVIFMFIWEKNKPKKVPDNWWFGGLMGASAGFATMIGNLAGPFANLFFLAIRLPKDQFIGTAAWLFFIINIFKLPFHIWSWGTISTETLAVNLRLFPAVLIGLFLGIRLVGIIQEKSYRILILVLTALGAILIFFSQ